MAYALVRYLAIETCPQVILPRLEFGVIKDISARESITAFAGF